MDKKVIKPLKGFNAFKKVFDAGKKFHHEHVSAVAIFDNDKYRDFKVRTIDDSSVLYYGVGVSKKVCKKAVVRNRIKRLLRVSINQFFATQSNINLKYLTLNWRKKVEKPSLISLKDVEPIVNKMLINILQKAGKEN